MRSIATFLLAGFALVSVCSIQNARAADAVAVEPAYVTPGKTITLKWYFTGEKVLLSGGRFGKGVVVTGKTSMTDTPRTTTKYTFDVWFKAPAPKTTAATPTDTPSKDPKGTDAKNAGSKGGDPKADGATAQETVLEHVQYSAFAEVWSGVYPPMRAYHDSHGWQVSCLSGWKRDNVPTPEEGSDGLNYFQPEDDSVERLAVAIMPLKDETEDDILKKVSEDVPAHYLHAVITDPVDVKVNSLPAKMLTFTGIDLTHPGTKTSSIVMVVIRQGKAYVLSTRTGAARFGSRRPILEKLLQSFTFNK